MPENILKKKIGIIGGGQLGKMMILEAKKLGFYTAILDPTPDCPAHSISDAHIVADFNDKDAFEQLSKLCDVITYEFEHINADALMELERNNVKVYPDPKSLKLIQNKYTQKQAMEAAGLPVPQMMQINDLEDLTKAGDTFGYPYILKACTGGYDGKGNTIVKNKASIDESYAQLGGGSLPLMAEKLIPFTMEVSVLACRGENGDVAVYPVGKNHHINSILEETVVPAPISETATKKAMEIAEKVMHIFKGVGMFCVELFVTDTEDILINEVAPRPHNSGHYTIEACVTSQFEQHIRAISGLPLGDTSLVKPVAMRNLLGEDNSTGTAFVSGIEDALSVKGAKVHIYGKSKTSPNRKMGHITVLGETIQDASARALEAKNKIRIIGEEN